MSVDLELVKQLRQEGYSTKEACNYLNISKGKLRYLGWNKLANPNINLTNTYIKNNNYFDNIDTINKAYILGFTLADGNIMKDGTLRYELNKKDVEILNFIKSEISPSSNLKEINRQRNYKGYSWNSNTLNLTIKSKSFYYDLDHLGIKCNKTYLTQHIPYISWRLMPHFIRGYFDGDGSVWIASKQDRPRINFTGEDNFLKELSDYLDYINVFSKIYKVSPVKNQNNSCLTVYKKEDVKSFYNYIYKEGFYLTRKKEKFNYELA